LTVKKLLIKKNINLKAKNSNYNNYNKHSETD